MQLVRLYTAALRAGLLRYVSAFGIMFSVVGGNASQPLLQSNSHMSLCKVLDLVSYFRLAPLLIA